MKGATDTRTSEIKAGWPQHFDYARKSNVENARPNAKAPLGQGGRFAALESKIAKRGGVRNPGAVAAFIGRKKYGKAKFQKMAAAGR